MHDAHHQQPQPVLEAVELQKTYGRRRVVDGVSGAPEASARVTLFSKSPFSSGAVTDFKADVVHSVTLPIRAARQAVDVIADVIEDGVRRCVGDAGLPIHAISGIGMLAVGTLGFPYIGKLQDDKANEAIIASYVEDGRERALPNLLGNYCRRLDSGPRFLLTE